MAGDWIKMRGNLWDDPRIARLCDLTDSGEAPVIGALYWLWATADQHTEDGILPGLTLRQIDRKTGVIGMGAALVAIGWLADHTDGVLIVRFDEHNGSSAKRRSMEAQRKANGRKLSASDADTERTPSAETPDESRKGCGVDAELEKEIERDKKNNPHTPRKRGEAAGVRFEEFWTAWPKCERKQDKAKCLAHWKRHDLDTQADAILADVRTKRGTGKWRDGYIEAPLVYLRGQRWLDGVTPNEGTPEAAVDWRATWKTIVAKGEELGLGSWSEDAVVRGDAPQFHVYRAKVEKRMAEIESGPADPAGQKRVAELLAGAAK